MSGRNRNKERDNKIRELKRSGVSSRAIAERYGLTTSRIQQINIDGVPSKSKTATKRAKILYQALVDFKIHSDGSTLPVHVGMKIEGINSHYSFYAALRTLEIMGLIERINENPLQVSLKGGKWIPPEEPNWEELL